MRLMAGFTLLLLGFSNTGVNHRDIQSHHFMIKTRLLSSFNLLPIISVMAIRLITYLQSTYCV